MKRLLKRGLSLILALALCAPAAYASDALGGDRIGRTTPLAKGTELTDNSLWSTAYSDLRSEHYITYTPNGMVSPMVWHCGERTDKASLSAAAAAMEAEGYRVVAGINGGFFNSDGTGVGLVMSDGVIRALDKKNHYMVGICRDGSLFVDGSVVEKTMFWSDSYGNVTEFEVAGINASRANGGVFLFNGDFGTSMENTLGGVDVVLRPLRPSRKLTMDCELTFVVEAVRDSTQAGVPVINEIPEGRWVLSANRKYNAAGLDALRSVAVGTEVTLTVSGADERWADAEYGLSAIHLLVENGQPVPGLGTGAAPRTAIGIKADGTAVFYTIDGRQKGYSVGASYSQVAKRLVELDCVTAVALDGGGSTTLGATLPGSANFDIISSPSGGGDRAVNNCILLVTSGGANDRKGGAYPESEFSVVMAGAQTVVSAKAHDTKGYPLETDREVSWDSDGGTFSVDEEGNTVFTAGSEYGTFQLNASLFGQTTSLPVRVVRKISSVSVLRRDVNIEVDTLLAEPGEMIPLGTEGIWYNLPVAMNDNAVKWSCTGAIGEITEDGMFIAGAENCEGTITAAVGGVSTTVRVRVDRGDPFTDIDSHWSQPYVTRLYKLGLTTGSLQEDGTYVYLPDDQLTRGQLLVFITRILDVDTSAYANMDLPFADADAIPGWMLPAVKTMYTLQVFNGISRNGGLYADVGEYINREETMTLLGRILAEQQSCDLSGFADAGQVSGWAAPYIQSLVSYGVVSGSGGYLNPQRLLSRGEIAKMLILVAELPHGELTPRAVEEENTTEVPVVEEIPGAGDLIDE